MYITKSGQVKAFEVPHNHVQAQKNISITTQDLNNLSVPALIIHGKEDYIALPIHARINAKSMPHSELILIPEMGHMFFNRNLERQLVDYIVAHMSKYGKGKN